MNNRKTRWIAALAGIALFTSLTACGTTEPTSAGSDQPANESPKAGPFKIATIPKVEGITWFDDMKRGVEQFNADNADVEAWQIGPDSEDAAKQVAIVEDLIAQNVDAIVVVPNDPLALEPVLTKARQQGIVVISHEGPALATTEAVDYDLEAFRNEVFGQLMAEKFVEGLGGKTSGTFVGEVGSLTSETHMAWYNAAVAWLAEKYPDIKPVQDKPYEDANDDAKARSNALEILKAYPELSGMLSCSVSAGSNMAQVLKEKNIKTVVLSQLTLPSVAGPYIEEGWIYSGQSWEPAGAGYAANQLALSILKGEQVASGMDLKWQNYNKVEVADKIVVGDAILQFQKGQEPFASWNGTYPF
ncbi:MAG: substrate-binding domain-containing protein [Propionibacteriaceae bacterium]|jgi:simple sugar transport system substrate-binding protein|nr:substrate-binding domain-containing protein [Propionibacteriaceae bacterium]